MDFKESSIRKFLRRATRPANEVNFSPGKNTKAEMTSTSDTDSNILDFSTTSYVDNGSTNFLKIYFDFAYYTCCSPFHFGSNGKCDAALLFAIKTWKPQQILCALLHSAAIIRLATETRRILPSLFTSSPDNYFLAVGSIVRLIFKLLAIKRLWRNQSQFLNIINYLATSKQLPFKNIFLQRKFLIRLYCTACLSLPLFVGINYYIVASPSSWSITFWKSISLADEGRFAFFMEKTNKSQTDPNAISVGDSFLAALMGIGVLERMLIGFMFDASLLAGVLTLWSAAHAFAKDLREDRESPDVWIDVSSGSRTTSWSELYACYKAIRDLSFLINSAYGSLVTVYLTDSILYHAIHLDAIVLTRDVSLQIYRFGLALNSVLVLVFSADVCNQLDTLKLWLSKDENRKMIPLDELHVVLHELNCGVVGIRGSNVFTITYSLMWNILTTIITYFIIAMQSRMSRNGTGIGH